MRLIITALLLSTSLGQLGAADFFGGFWSDANGDGVRSDSETAVPPFIAERFASGGTWVTLTSGGTSRSVQVGLNGLWGIGGLPEGTWTITYTPTYPYAPVLPDQGGDDARDSDFSPGAAPTAIVDTLASGIRVFDSGVARTHRTLWFRSWCDLNRNGQRDAGEPVIEQYPELLNGDGSSRGFVYPSAMEDGKRGFADIAPGTYRIRFTAQPGLALTIPDQGPDATDSDADPSSRMTPVITLGAGDIDLEVDAGYAEARADVTLGTWIDTSRDGLRQPGETLLLPFQNAQLEVQNGTYWAPVNATYTDTPERLRTWAQLMPGHYRATFIQYPDFALVPANVGADDTIDSDVDLLARVEFDLNGSNLRFDAGFASRRGDVTLGTWIDISRDGLRQPGETTLLPFQNAQLEMQNGTYWTPVGGPYTDTPERLRTWAQLMPGHYRATFIQYPDFALVPANVGTDDTIDSDVDALARVEFDIDGVNRRFDAGFASRRGDVTLGTWIDTSRDGLRQPGETTLLPFQNAQLEMQNGTYWSPVGGPYTDTPERLRTWTQLMPGHYRATFIQYPDFALVPANVGSDDTIDSDVDALARIEFDIDGANQRFDAGFASRRGDVTLGTWIDTSRDGLRQPGETTLLPFQNAQLEMQNGTYWSPVGGPYTDTPERLRTWAQLMPGHYRATFIQYPDFALVADNVGSDDTIDSEVDALARIEFDIDGANQRFDAGFASRRGDVTLGTWIDTSRDGLRQPGETTLLPFQNAQLEMQNGTYWSPVGGPYTDTPERLRTWTQLMPGHYRATFTLYPDFAPIPANLGTDDTIDSDVDASARVEFDIDGANQRFDAGYVQLLGAFVGRVWFDGDADGVQDAGEPGRAGVTVSCQTAGGTPVATLTTDAAGQFALADLAPGSYRLSAPALAGRLSATDAGGDDLLDSDFMGDASVLLQVLPTQTVRADAGIRNGAPLLSVLPVVLPEDGQSMLTLSATDPEAEAVTWLVSAPPLHGTLQGTAPILSYRPQANWSGSDAITVQVTDAWGLTASAVLAITVTPVNDAPTLAAVTLATIANTPVSRSLNGADVEGGVLTYRVASAATRGTATITGSTLSYVPKANATGSDAFTVEVVDSAGGVGTATVTVAITGAGLPVPWALAAIGSVAPAPTTAYNWTSRIHTLSGAGLGLTAKADAAALLSQPITGDVTIIAKVASQVKIGSATRAGLTFRDSTASGSRHASLLLSPTNGLSFLRRTALNGSTTSTSGGTPSTARRWLRLQRVGTTVTAASSVDGTTWTVLGSATVTLNATLRVGLVSTSGVAGTSSAATFESVQVILPAALRTNG